ncbi:hypothetical protein BKA93DRAFT_824723 [Sparassis latifolia]
MDYPDITVNHFTVCQRHGQEQCTICNCDHRVANNAASGVEDELHDLIQLTDFWMPYRQSQNVYELGAVAVGAPSVAYKCNKHDTQDCGICFDWVTLIGDEIIMTFIQEAWTMLLVDFQYRHSSI